MKDLSANVRLRPTRIGFLVRPTDKKSVREIMRTNACLWGGLYNPIIPIFSNTPKEWKEQHHHSLNGKAVAEGYIKFFEPDVFVEAENGLLEKAGLGSFRKDRFDSSVVSLEQFFDTEYRGFHIPRFGQTISDVIDNAYQSERRFNLRDEYSTIYPELPNDAFSELCIGVYPDNKKIDYFKLHYHEVFRPTTEPSTAKTWLKIFGKECVSPFSVTSSHFDVIRNSRNDPVIFVFDPEKTTDLIDAWNLRIESSQVFLVPILWFSDLSSSLIKFIESNFRPLKNNQHGVMHRTTIEIARSISEEQARDQILSLLQGLPNGSFSFKLLRTRIWDVNYDNTQGTLPERTKLSASEKNKTIVIKGDNELYTGFETISPDFSETYSGSKNRWVNVLTISAYTDCNLALNLPYNTFDNNWLRTGLSEFNNGREGWVFCQDHKNSTQSVRLLRNDEAFTHWFKLKNIQVTLSDPGRIAKEMLESLEGFWGLYLLDNEETLMFVNKLAGSARVWKNPNNEITLQEDYPNRAARIDIWDAHVKRFIAKGIRRSVDISKYIERNIIRLGIETDCSHCNAKNWHDLNEVSYEIKCSRCIKIYKFPQGNLKKFNGNWKYRVIGPFAVPDYAQGAYTSLLTIRFFTKFLNKNDVSSFTTAIDMIAGKTKCEVDFAIWISNNNRYDVCGEPRLIIGEAKSFALNAVTEEALLQLKAAAELMPKSILVVSVLKTEFSNDEVIRLKEFVRWARVPIKSEPRHLVILLTGTELFNEFLEDVWEKKGEPFSRFSDYSYIHDFECLSDATLTIYLGLPSFQASLM
ncbi:MAG: hypothetical protein V4732_15215 [Pseudomonadota bacterium]